MIILPETRIARIPMPGNAAALQMKIRGFWRLKLRNRDGSVVKDTGWFPNLIVNNGMAMVRDTNGWNTYCELGSSSQAPAVTDTGVISSLGSRQGGFNTINGYVAGGSDYFYQRRTYRFSEGESTGPIREISLNKMSTGNPTLTFNRSLVVDETQTVTTINKGADQILDAYYEIRNYPPTGDSTGSIDISGTTYDYTVRPSRVYSGSGQWGNIAQETISSNASFHFASDNSLVARSSTTLPTNSVNLFGVSGCTFTVTGSGDYYNDIQLQCGIDGWIFGTGIRTVILRTGNCEWQIQYAKTTGGGPIDKTNEDRLRLKYRLSWAKV